MSLARIIIVGLGVVGAAAFIAWQIYKRRQLASYKDKHYDADGRVAYFVPGADGTLSEEECAICLDAMQIIHKVHKLPCRHMFHLNCIELWARYDRSCPLCRNQFEIVSRRR